MCLESYLISCMCKYYSLKVSQYEIFLVISIFQNSYTLCGHGLISLDKKPVTGDNNLVKKTTGKA